MKMKKRIKKKYDELVKIRENEIIELEQKFIQRKNELKTEFINKMENIKKSYNEEKLLNMNIELFSNIKKTFVKIFNDKNMINKKGIYFNLKDYKKKIKNNINSSNLATNSIMKK